MQHLRKDERRLVQEGIAGRASKTLIVLLPRFWRLRTPEHHQREKAGADEEKKQQHTTLGILTRKKILAPNTPRCNAGDDGCKGEEGSLCSCQ